MYEALVNANNSVGLINSDLRSEERQDVLERFVSGKVKFLVGTDVISRGIDANVSLVINYVSGLVSLIVDRVFFSSWFDTDLPCSL